MARRVLPPNPLPLLILPVLGASQGRRACSRTVKLGNPQDVSWKASAVDSRLPEPPSVWPGGTGNTCETGVDTCSLIRHQTAGQHEGALSFT